MKDTKKKERKKAEKLEKEGERPHKRQEEERRKTKRNMAEWPQCLCSEKFPKKDLALKCSNSALPPSISSEVRIFLPFKLPAV